MYENRIANRIKRVSPLLLNGRHLFKEPHILQRQAQKIGNVNQIRDLVTLKTNALKGAHGDNSDRPVFSRQSQRNALADPALFHPPALFSIDSFLSTPQQTLSLHHPLNPRPSAPHPPPPSPTL